MVGANHLMHMQWQQPNNNDICVANEHVARDLSIKKKWSCICVYDTKGETTWAFPHVDLIYIIFNVHSSFINQNQLMYRLQNENFIFLQRSATRRPYNPTPPRNT